MRGLGEVSLPLLGKRVVITRPAVRAKSLVVRLDALGATVMSLPAIEFKPVEDSAEFDAALRNGADYDVVVFTSVTGVEFVSARMRELGLAVEGFARAKIAVVGPATAAAVENWIRKPDVMPPEYVAEAIAGALGDVAGLRILMLRADLARPDLKEILTARGADVDEIAAYRIVAADASRYDWNISAPQILCVTSAASARTLADMLKSVGHADWLESSAIVCIGPITRDAVEAMGYRVAATAKEYTETGLVDAILEMEAAHA